MSLSIRLALFASLLVSATSLLIGVVLTQRATEDLYNDLEMRGLAIARGLSTQASPLVEQNKPKELQRLLDGFWEERNVSKVEVVGIQGRILASNDLGLPPAKINNAVVMYALNGTPDPNGFREGLGVVRVTLSAAGVEAHRERYLSHALRLSFGVAGCGILLAIGMGIVLALPLGRLSKSASSVASGNYLDALAKLKLLPKGSGPEVRQLSDALSHAVHAVSIREDELKAVNELLGRTEAARDSMTHMVIHDLKGPIGKVVTLMEVIETQNLDQDDQQLVLEVQKRSRLLLRRIDEQLEQARGAQATLTVNKEPNAIASLVDKAIDQIDHIATEADFQITRKLPSSSQTIKCDEAIMVRAIQNLLSNAIRYGKSPIKIAVKIQKRTLELSVEDNGPGVPPGKEDLIFEKFQSFLPNNPSKRLGSGLGLAFVKTAVEAHNGKIKVNKAKFTMTLPI